MIIIIIHINIQNNTNIQKILALVRNMNNMERIFVQCVVYRNAEVYDINMSILYGSMIITRLFILRVVTITLLPIMILIIVLQLVIFTYYHVDQQSNI